MPPLSTIADRLSAAGRRTGPFRERLQKWFVISFIVGAVTGVGVAGVDALIYDVVWRGAKSVTPRALISFLPMAALLASAFLMKKYSPDKVHGTEEVIKSYHEQAGKIDVRSAWAKIGAAVATIGLGGSVGLEGPSVHIGALVGSWMQRWLSRFGFDDEDRRWMMLAGAAAGIAAIFRAPLTGIVFALEVPYRDDLAHRALIPALTASVTSYFFFVTLIGTQPLFVVEHSYNLDYRQLLLATLLGVVCGLTARCFVLFFKWSEKTLHARLPSTIARALVGGTIVSGTGIASLAIFEAPLSLGTGYEGIRLMLGGRLVLSSLLMLFILKAVATSATLASGGVGGTFIPLIFLGAATGSAFGSAVQSSSVLYPIVGMAGFLAAGYSVPLAAAAFVAETTGSPGFIIPGLLAAAISFAFSGQISLSSFQRFGRQAVIQRMLNAEVEASMTTPAIVVPAAVSVNDFVRDYVVKYRHLHFPVEQEGMLVGMVGVDDLRRLPEEEWSAATVMQIARKDLVGLLPSTSVAEAVRFMQEQGLDRLPVVSAADESRVIGIVALADILRLEELASFVEPAGKDDTRNTRER
ncbi:MAG: chloride channel protein [Actinobacteria bacterium]|nr:MAG: chloride channel protein [Actinomycetota bacterium]